MSKAERLGHANALVQTISRHGRRFFFNCETGAVARLELDSRGRVWWIDEYRGGRIYTEKMMACGHGWRGFSHGGTLRSLVESLRDYVKRGDLLNPEFIAPSYVNSSYGDYWGYGAEAAEAVRAEAHQLPMFDQSAGAQKGSVL